MPPKKGGKKNKKDLDSDDYWANKEVDVDPIAKAAAEAQSSKGKKQAKSAYELLEQFEAGGGLDDDEDDEAGGGGGGGLMAAMQSRKDRKPKASKKQTAPVSDDEDDLAPTAAPQEAVQADLDDEWPEEDLKKSKKGKKDKKGKKGGKKIMDDDDVQADDMEADDTTAQHQPVEAATADLDDEWPEEDVKPKKSKKGKKQPKKQDEDDDDVETPAAPTPEAQADTAAPSAPTAAAVDQVEDQDEDAGEVKILSKKEKEKLKKEKEKAKKKAQAERKKAEAAASGGAAPASGSAEPKADETEPTPDAGHKDDEAEEDDDEGGAGGAGAADKKKKKKKKKAADKAEPEPVKKKVNPKVAALAAAMEKKKQLEEEARRAEEEARLAAEEEERRLAEEERLAEEARLAKREREKEKREQARKEGRLLTPKQKAEKAAAEARMKALLASGVKVEGLQQQDGSAPAKPKKVVYGNKKKQQQKKHATEPSKPAPEPVKEEPKATPAPAAAQEDSDDDWDKSDTEEVTKAVEKVEIKEDSGDDWDKSSDEEPEPPKPAAPAATASKTAGTPAKGTQAKKAQPAQEESEDESSSEDDSDEDSDSDSDDSDSDSDDSSSEDELTPAQRKAAAEAEKRKQEAAARRKQRHEEAMAARSKDDLRSPICCILGHVDTGKTKLLDKIRQTSVQEGEAGGITQQIGATYFPVEAIKEKTAVVNKDGAIEYKIPGLLIIDTPGHESFTNLRTRGSSLCNIAILVVDITHGLEPQTLESIRLLRERKTPFIVALNKIDRCYGWQNIPNGGFRETFAQQNANTQREFNNRLEATKLAFAEQGFNAVLYDENKDFGRYVSLVPTSAITGEGIPDMIMLLVKLTQQRMSERLMYLSELECTVLEVKVIEGLGTTIDVVLSNGVMHEGDRIVVCGLNGPIVTNVRALLTPQPLRELRVKSAYVHHKEVKAALGIKIAAPGLEKAIAGSRLLVVGPDDDEEELMDEIMSDLKGMEEYIDQSGRGVWVQASTLGSLEALLEFLRSSKIPVMGINIGPVYKRDIMRCAAMLEKAPEYAVVLSFDVEVDKDARKLAEELNVKVFEAQIIYHLFDAFTKYMGEVLEARRKDAAPNAVWPCRLKIIAAFAKRDPIVVGVDLIEGTLRTGTPICVVKTNAEGKKEIIPLGKISSIEINHSSKDIVKKSQMGAGAAIKIDHAVWQSAKSYGRHFDDKDELISHISRQSIDVLKTTFRDQVELSDWALIKALKPKLDIQ